MFKKYIYIASLLFSLMGCNYLDFDESVGQEKEFAYSYFNELTRSVTHIYGQLRSEYGEIGGALREAATDNAVYTWQNNAVYDMYYDTWSPINTIDSQWSHYYSAIRSANVFLENLDFEKLERFMHNPSYEDDLAMAKMYPYEVRFLRAFFFFELAKRYGDIPLLTRSYSIDEINSVEKTPFQSVVDFIKTECDTVVKYLPASHQSFYNETGRITKGAAMALKSRALLYAASTLHNKSNDIEKWQQAAKAAGELITSSEENGWYRLVSSADLFGSGNAVLTADELIFERRNGNSNNFEARNLPIGFEGGNSGNTPTQNLVDAFEMSDGSDFDWNNPTHAANPYLNRDPRFYKIIAFNGSTLMDQVVESYFGGANGAPINGATLTGYYLKKYINETVSLDPQNPSEKPHHFVLFRYAEILLNYAEALNEVYGPDYSDATFVMTAREAINQVRTNAQMPPISDNSDKDSFRTRIRNERRVELAFEDHRFWDIRRWKIGSVVRNIYGIEILKNDMSYNYTKIHIQDRVWDDKMYLYPIPQSEVFINTNLVQNPGW